MCVITCEYNSNLHRVIRNAYSLIFRTSVYSEALPRASLCSDVFYYIGFCLRNPQSAFFMSFDSLIRTGCCHLLAFSVKIYNLAVSALVALLSSSSKSSRSFPHSRKKGFWLFRLVHCSNLLS